MIFYSEWNINIVYGEADNYDRPKLSAIKVATLTWLWAFSMVSVAIISRTPALKRSDSRKICPSVIEITLVGIYADTSPA